MSLLKTKKKGRPLIIPGTIAEDEEFQFLGSVEEITDYELIDAGGGGGGSWSSSSGKSKKRTKSGSSEQTTSESAAKRVKKLKKPKISIENDSEFANNAEKKSKQTKRLKGNFEETRVEDTGEWGSLLVAENICRALADEGFQSPTPIQIECIPSTIRDKLDILGAAETGSGKTLAFGIPLVQGLEEDGKNGKLGALILTPTRELAIQVKNHILAILRYTTLKIAAVVGGLSMQKQERILASRPQIVVGTPGRLWALMKEASRESFLGDLSGLRFLVVDETDRMVEKGHFEELAQILEHLQEKSKCPRQTLVFSATLTYVHPAPRRFHSAESVQMTPKQKIEMLVSLMGLRKKRKVVDLTRPIGTAESLTEARINCDSLLDKDTSLYYFLLRYPGRTLVFTNSVDSARRLQSLFSKLEFKIFLLHAHMQQKQRFKNLEKFAESEAGVLVATDVAARGLDIQGIQHVVHYHVPRTAEMYVHRSGRTARVQREGLSLMLVDPNDAAFYRRICRNLNRAGDLPVFPMDSPRVLSELKTRLRTATELEALEHRLKRKSAKEHWFLKAAQEAELDLDPAFMQESNASLGEEEQLTAGRRVKVLQKQLKALCGQPLDIDGRVETRYVTFELAEEVKKKQKRKTAVESAKDAARRKTSKGPVRVRQKKKKMKWKKKSR